MTDLPRTPLSELLDRYIESRSSDLWERFLEMFRQSKLGVRMNGIPEGIAGDFVSTPQNPVSVDITTYASGRPMVLAFADPDAFAQRFGNRFNALIAGESLLSTVLLNEECEGVLINSATKEVSVVIDRAAVRSLIDDSTSRILLGTR